MSLRSSRPRVALAAALAAVATSAGIWAGGSAEAGFDERPNVVVVMTDDQNLRDLSVMRRVRNRLAKQGVTFKNAFATFPLCCPSRASFFTGRYAHNHGVTANNASEGGGFANYDDSNSLPIALSAAGYRTGLIGKYLNGYDGSIVPDGWSRWAAKSRGGRMYHYQLNVDGKDRPFGGRDADYQTDVITRLSEQFIRSSAGKSKSPFFLVTSYSAPHTELRPSGPGGLNPRPARRHKGDFTGVGLPRPPSFNEEDVSDKPSFVSDSEQLSPDRISKLRRLHRSRLESLLAVDEGVVELFRSLRVEGELENTYVIFLSDNGFLLGEHRVDRKTLLYEESVRVPLLMRGPGLAAGAVRQQIVGNIDVAPTIYELTETTPLQEPDGISVLPFALDPQVGEGRDILLENRRSAGVRAPGFVYLEHDNDGDGSTDQRELYDLEEDPFQLESVHNAGGYAGIRAQLNARLDELRDCAGSQCG